MGILSVFSRFWTSVLFFLSVLDALLRLELWRFDVVEQMNKKVDLTRLKKTTHFSTKMRRLKTSATDNLDCDEEKPFVSEVPLLTLIYFNLRKGFGTLNEILQISRKN